MKAYRLAGWKQGGHYVEVAKPEAGPEQVLIRIGGAGICHSDLHIMHEWSPETMPELEPISPDFTLGHENAGWIETIGPGVPGWEEGQAVAVSPVWSCGRCAACRDGDDAYCEGPQTGSGGCESSTHCADPSREWRLRPGSMCRPERLERRRRTVSPPAHRTRGKRPPGC